MPKLKIEDLAKIKEDAARITTLREGGPYKTKITVHMGTCGIAAGARKIMDSLIEEIEKRNAQDVLLTTSGCAGLCSREPMITVEAAGQAPVKYVELTAEKTKEIFQKHIIGGRLVKEYALAIGSERAV
jgi:NADP-reducing hydrogenase subunit HndB